MKQNLNGLYLDTEQDEKNRGWSRREFLQAMAILGLSGIVAYDRITEALRKSLEQEILYSGESVTDIVNNTKIKGKSHVADRTGKGVIIDDKVYTVAHIAEDKYNYVRTRFGIGKITNDVEYTKNFVDGVELENLLINHPSDSAVLHIPEMTDNMKQFPYKPIDRDLKLGEVVYIIGNPQLKGNNTRKVRVSDLDGVPLQNSYFNKDAFFGVDSALIGGDSGSPVVNDEGRLVGLCSFYFTAFGYITKIQNFKR